METSLRGLSNEALLAQLEQHRRRERVETCELLACLSEVKRRSLYEDYGFPSLFDFCVGRLGYAESSAYSRVRSAQAAARFPELYVFLREGQLSLTAVARLEPHLTRENFDSVVARAIGKKAREIEGLIAELFLGGDAPAPESDSESEVEQNLFDFAPDDGAPAPSLGPVDGNGTMNHRVVLAASVRRRDVVRFEARGIVRFSFQADPNLRERIDRVRELLKRSCPSGRLDELLHRLVDEFLLRHDPVLKSAAPERAARERETRRIPQWVKDRVWARDGGRCAFAAADGRRCEARSNLELDHVVPWALGGKSDDPGNVRLLCRAHNLNLARKAFGDRVPARAEG